MEFNPERWTDLASTDNKEASQPFLVGPRACIGRKQVILSPCHRGMTIELTWQSFAYMEMNLLMAKMFWTYDLELVNKDIDWLKESKVHVLWWKPKLCIRFHKSFQASQEAQM